MKAEYDLIIIGSGPTGITAARQASEYGLNFILLDEQGYPGGNVYRNYKHVLSEQPELTAALGQDYQKGPSIMAHDFLNTETYVSEVQVWSIKQDGEVAIKRAEKVSILNGKRILIATGAIERPVPLSGWTLPGVITLGAAQTLLKSAQTIPDAPPVIVGSGPLVFLIIQQYLNLGLTPAAILLSGPLLGKRNSFSSLVRALSHPIPLLKGVWWVMRSILSSAKVFSNVSNIRIKGNERAESISFLHSGKKHEIKTNIIFLHEGVVPNTSLTMAADCEHYWDKKQYCWAPLVDKWGQTSAPNIYVAGDGVRIMGAGAAPLTAALAMLSIATDLGKMDKVTRDQRACPLRKQFVREEHLRNYLDQKFAPPVSIRKAIPDDVMICRCENITAGEIRALTNINCSGPNQAKAFTRCGMGPCQGRMCNLSVTEIMADSLGRTPQEIGHYRIRAPIKSVSVEEMATLGSGKTSEMKMVFGK